MVTVIWRAWDSIEGDIIWKWMEEDLVDGNDLDGVYGWFGQKVI